MSSRAAALFVMGGLAVFASRALADPMEGRIAYLGLTEGYWQVWTAAPDGSESRQVTRSPYDKSRHSWFPDGKHILANGVGGELYKVSVETGEEEAIDLSPRGTADAVLSPDGSWIAYSLSTAGSVDDNEIWVARADGTGPRRMTSMPHLQHEPAWSPDGRWIYFLSGDGKQSHDVWRISVEGGRVEQLTVGSLYHFELAPGPGGRLAYSSNRSGNYEIYVQEDGDGASPRRLTDNASLDGGPSWSPEGGTLLFHSQRSGRLGLWRVDAKGGAATAIPVSAELARAPSWWRPAPESKP